MHSQKQHGFIINSQLKQQITIQFEIFCIFSVGNTFTTMEVEETLRISYYRR